MAEEAPTSVDLWSVLEEAAETVEGWEDWRREYEVDITEALPPPSRSAPRT
jgi:hypothetical protein